MNKLKMRELENVLQEIEMIITDGETKKFAKWTKKNKKIYEQIKIGMRILSV